jgi:hypothetical protein
MRFNCDSHAKRFARDHLEGLAPARRTGRVKPGEPPLGQWRYLRDNDQF